MPRKDFRLSYSVIASETVEYVSFSRTHSSNVGSSLNVVKLCTLISLNFVPVCLLFRSFCTFVNKLGFVAQQELF